MCWRNSPKKSAPSTCHKVACDRRALDAIVSCHVERVGSLERWHSEASANAVRPSLGLGAHLFLDDLVLPTFPATPSRTNQLVDVETMGCVTCTIFTRIGPSVTSPRSIASHHRLGTIVCPPSRLAPLAPLDEETKQFPRESQPDRQRAQRPWHNASAVRH